MFQKLIGIVGLLAIAGNLPAAQKYSLLFGGLPQGGATASVVTTAIDNLTLEATLTWHGPLGTSSGVQTALYNGNSSCSGWGVTIRDSDGAVGILAGGNAIVFSAAQLQLNRAQDVRLTRTAGVFQLTVDGVGYAIENAPPNPIHSCSGEYTAIGAGTDLFNNLGRNPDPFNGWIADLHVNQVEFPMYEGSGPITVADNGAVMNLYGSPEWSKAPDAAPPAISGMPTSCSIWPPNNKLVTVAVISAADPGSGVAAFSVTGASNEPSDPKNPDIVISGSGVGPRVVQLRASRLGTGDGRVYTITATATDRAGNTASSVATCTVPHDQGK